MAGRHAAGLATSLSRVQAGRATRDCWREGARLARTGDKGRLAVALVATAVK